LNAQLTQFGASGVHDGSLLLQFAAALLHRAVECPSKLKRAFGIGKASPSASQFRLRRRARREKRRPRSNCHAAPLREPGDAACASLSSFGVSLSSPSFHHRPRAVPGKYFACHGNSLRAAGTSVGRVPQSRQIPVSSNLAQLLTRPLHSRNRRPFLLTALRQLLHLALSLPQPPSPHHILPILHPLPITIIALLISSPTNKAFLPVLASPLDVLALYYLRH
jgi:hypothetical protein